MSKSQKHKVSNNKFIVNIQYPYNIYGTSVDEDIKEAVGDSGFWGDSVFENNRSISVYSLQESEAVGIVSRVLGLGIEELQASYFEDDYDDLDDGGDW